MKKTGKILLLVLCAVLLVVGSVMGTMAYLTSDSKVVNTFTVGNIEIKLDEAKVNTAGEPVSPAERHADGNEYHLLPNLSYTKDPTVWVKEGSEEAYIRMIVTVEKYDNMLKAFNSGADYDDGYIVDDASTVLGTGSSGKMVVLDNLVDRNSSAWECVKFTQDTTADTGVYEFRYYPGAYKASADNDDSNVDYDELPALFTKITVPAEIDNEHLAYLNDATISVVAQAIQTTGFNSVEEAWGAFTTD